MTGNKKKFMSKVYLDTGSKNFKSQIEKLSNKDIDELFDIFAFEKWKRQNNSDTSLFKKNTSGKAKYINDLMDKGKINSKMEVLTSLDDVALYLAKVCEMNITKRILDVFINPKTKKKYSDSAKKQAVNHALN